jgi:hypothetical protein
MTSTHNVRLLWRQYMTLSQWKLGLTSTRRVVGRISSGHFVWSNNIFLSSGTPLSNGRLTCERSWMLVWSCTTWSPRVSAIIQCMMIIHMIVKANLPKKITTFQPCLDIFLPCIAKSVIYMFFNYLIIASTIYLPLYFLQKKNCWSIDNYQYQYKQPKVIRITDSYLDNLATTTDTSAS